MNTTRHTNRVICAVPHAVRDKVNAVLARHGFGKETFSRPVKYVGKLPTMWLCDAAFTDGELAVVRDATKTLQFPVADVGSLRTKNRLTDALGVLKVSQAIVDERTK